MLVNGKTLVCNKRDRAIICVFRRDLYLTSLLSGLLQKDLLAESFFNQIIVTLVTQGLPSSFLSAVLLRKFTINFIFIVYSPLTGQESTISSALSGSKTLKLTATISGGKGDVAWQHAQLFRQSFDSQSEYPLDIAVFFRESDRDTHL